MQKKGRPKPPPPLGSLPRETHHGDIPYVLVPDLRTVLGTIPESVHHEVGVPDWFGTFRSVPHEVPDPGGRILQTSNDVGQFRGGNDFRGRHGGYSYMVGTISYPYKYYIIKRGAKLWAK